jgi:hypothetical protein
VYMGVVERTVLLISIFTHQYVVSFCPDRLSSARSLSHPFLGRLHCPASVIIPIIIFITQLPVEWAANPALQTRQLSGLCCEAGGWILYCSVNMRWIGLRARRLSGLWWLSMAVGCEL